MCRKGLFAAFFVSNEKVEYESIFLILQCALCFLIFALACSDSVWKSEPDFCSGLRKFKI